jgi:SAM-dependent methyltransferase
MSSTDHSRDDLKSTVRDKYAALATEDDACCGSSGRGEAELDVDVSEEYGETIAADADLDLGCGRPTDHADLQPGERVLDLGAGAGMDAFVARRDVGPDGHVHGVDFAEEMVAKARTNADKMDYDNVTFEQGDIEALPVESGAFDVILSNCVLNLVPDKEAAFAQMHRALRPGGRFSVSDIVHGGTFPDELREVAELYVGCIAGAMERAPYLDLVRTAGFVDVQVVTEKHIDVPEDLLTDHLDAETIESVRASGVGLQSVTIVGRRPID